MILPALSLTDNESTALCLVYLVFPEHLIMLTVLPLCDLSPNKLCHVSSHHSPFTPKSNGLTFPLCTWSMSISEYPKPTCHLEPILTSSLHEVFVAPLGSTFSLHWNFHSTLHMPLLEYLQFSANIHLLPIEFCTWPPPAALVVSEYPEIKIQPTATAPLLAGPNVQYSSFVLLLLFCLPLIISWIHFGTLEVPVAQHLFISN